ncbi:DUF2905 domain-containing protein [Paraburkholderia sp. SIMBA_054]
MAAGLGWRWLSRLPPGRLPGDVNIVRPGFSFPFSDRDVHRHFSRFVDPDLAVQAMSPRRSFTRKRPQPRELTHAICGRFNSVR